MTAPLGEDEFTELVDADIPRVDLVDKAANGMRFLIAKQADGARGLLDPAFVRDLVAKADPQSGDDGKDTVTMTGNPAAIAKFIHEAAQRTPGPVAKETLMTTVAKAEDLDPTEVLAEPDETYDGIPTSPGSPAWEAVDAATARKWTSILARAKGAIDLLADREMLEAASGDEGDAMQAMDLQDACCAIDYAISVLAPFAVAEQAEADCAEQMQAVGKALDGFDATSLDVIEALGQVRKAGRVLSTANEAAIRGAVESLQKVLASLPSAPTADDSGQPVAKTEETPVTAPVETAPVDTPQADAAPQGNVVKADDVKPQMVAVYDAKGTLVGVVDPTDITRIAGAEPDKDDVPAADATAGADAAPAAEAADMQPAPAAEVGTPADDGTDDNVAKTTAATSGASNTSTPDVESTSIADVVKQHLDAFSATHAQTVTDLVDTVAKQAETIEVLKGQVQALGDEPAAPRVFTNGAVPPANMLRGQDKGVVPVDVAKAAELKQVLYKGTATEQNEAFATMQDLAVAKLQELHQRH